MKQPPAYLPYAQHHLDAADIAAVLAVLRDGALTQGPQITAFEQAFAARMGVRCAVACANGTAALHLAYLAAGIGPGSQVIVPTLTFAATANAVLLAGGEVVFADVDSESGLLTPETLAMALNRTPQAQFIVVVHLNGQCADLATLKEVANGRPLLVDAAHAIGAVYQSANDEHEIVGGSRYAQLTTFSFHPAKNMTSAEGGMVTTDDEILAMKMRRLLNHGIARNAQDLIDSNQALDNKGQPNPWYYEVQQLGLNYRLSDVHCALGLSQLNKLEPFITRRAKLVAYYDAQLATHLPMVQPIKRRNCGTPAWHLYPVLIDFSALKIERAALMRYLWQQGIGTQVHYIPLHKQPYYCNRYGEQSLPSAERYYQRVLSLPLFTTLTEMDVDRIVNTLIAGLIEDTYHA